MAVFPNQPEDALKAAVEMQQTLIKYNDYRARDGRPPIRMGIGLHSGSLIMGIIGDKDRMDATTIADTVNTASRIESLTKYYGAQILLSEDTMEKLQETENGVYHLRYLGKVKVKGKKEALGIYECFEGDLPKILDSKRKTVVHFEEGLAHFYAKEFPEAIAVFNTIIKESPKDQVANFFLNKSSRFIHEGVPEDWTGVEVMTFK